jgi:hypothetical protein
MAAHGFLNVCGITFHELDFHFFSQNSFLFIKANLNQWNPEKGKNHTEITQASHLINAHFCLALKHGCTIP